MKKISPNKNKSSSFSRIMRKGQERANYKARSGKLLMLMSEEDHQRIAKLISKWLAQDEAKR
ncbi:MAG: hypothetical protein SVW51_12475 [Pseudomonadota bacterium]|nr:hypothetical protein [Pseudomonadota bacterium]